MASFNNFGANLKFASTGGVHHGDTIYGVTLTGMVVGGSMKHSDWMLGGSKNDYLVGGDKDDFMYGRRGDDVLTGGGGDDHFVFKPHSGHDVITDFSDGDQIHIEQYLKNGVSVQVHDTTAGAVINFGTGESVTLLGV